MVNKEVVMQTLEQVQELQDQNCQNFENPNSQGNS
jgi:hypothetical protein